MVKFITLGNYDKKYRFIIFYILIMLPLQYFLVDYFPDEMKIKFFRNENFPKDVLIFDIFKYLGISILGLIASKLEFKNIFIPNNDNKPKLSANSHRI